MTATHVRTLSIINAKVLKTWKRWKRNSRLMRKLKLWRIKTIISCLSGKLFLRRRNKRSWGRSKLGMVVGSSFSLWQKSILRTMSAFWTCLTPCRSLGRQLLRDSHQRLELITRKDKINSKISRMNSKKQVLYPKNLKRSLNSSPTPTNQVCQIIVVLRQELSI